MGVEDGAPRLRLQVDRVVTSVTVRERSASGPDSQGRARGVHVEHRAEALEDVASEK